MEPAGITTCPAASFTSATTLAVNSWPGFAVRDVIVSATAMSRKEPLAAVYTTDAGGGGAFGVTCTGVLVRVRTGGAVGVVVAGTLAPTSRSAAPDSACAVVRLRAALSPPCLFPSPPFAQPTIGSFARH